jgi:hypothetical protein
MLAVAEVKCEEWAMKRKQILISALAALVAGWACVAEAQPIPSSAVVCYLIGRFYFDPNTGKGEVGGYFSDINGIGASDSLFNGTPSERTAFFTFHTTLTIRARQEINAPFGG